MAHIAKRLTFDDTGGLSAGSVNAGALKDLRKAHEEVTAAIKQRSSQLMELARQAADGGSENDLKRLQRQFQTLKATFVNCDIKERFMQGLEHDQLDAKQQEQLNKEREQQLESDADTLREMKDQNSQGRDRIRAKIGCISELYARMDAASATTQGQLDGIQHTIEQHEAGRPAPDSPLEPGPSEAECQALLEQETGRAKQLETSIAATEAGNADLEASIHAQEHELQAMKGEVERLQALHVDRAKAADADASTRQAAEWCEETASIISKISGVSITSIEQDSLQLQLVCTVPLTSGLAQQSAAQHRTMEHELSLSFQPGTARVHTAKLTPSVVPLDDIVQCASEGHEKLQFVVTEVRSRVLAYWQRQLLVEAAAERYNLTGMGPNEPSMKATLPNGLEAEVSVPWQWRSEAAAGGLRLLKVAGGAVDGAALVEAVNGDVALGGRDLLGFLDGVAAAAAAQHASG